jgi:uncharacterized membrane protein
MQLLYRELKGLFMIALYVGILLFGGLHLWSIFCPAMRNRLYQRFGEQAYKGVYSLVSVLGLLFIGLGYALTNDLGFYLYQPSAGAMHITMLLVLVGFVLIASNGGKGYIRKWVKHPFSIGICLWAIGHLISNGETAVVLIFGMFLVISIFDIAFAVSRGKLPNHKPEIKRDVIAVVAGLAAYAVMLFLFHPYVLGIKVVG